jgi:hypothetical protein
MSLACDSSMSRIDGEPRNFCLKGRVVHHLFGKQLIQHQARGPARRSYARPRCGWSDSGILAPSAEGATPGMASGLRLGAAHQSSIAPHNDPRFSDVKSVAFDTSAFCRPRERLR